MKIFKWGSSLAIRLPSSIVEVLKLNEGDEVDVRVAGERTFDIALDRSRERALKRIKAMRIKLPPDWKFDREEINSR